MRYLLGEYEEGAFCCHNNGIVNFTEFDDLDSEACEGLSPQKMSVEEI